MEKELFKNIEEKLYRYYSKEKQIKSIENKIKILDRQIESIESDLRQCNITIDEESSSLSFEERVQTSSDGTSYAEREVMRVTEQRIKRKLQKELEREDLKELIDTIELDNAIIEYNIQFLNEEYKILLEMKYGKKYNEQKISCEMNLSQSQVNKIKQKVIEDIRRWEEWRKVE